MKIIHMQVARYYTSDGKEFASHIEAIAHERRQAVRELIYGAVHSGMYPDEIAELIIDKYDDLEAIMQQSIPIEQK